MYLVRGQLLLHLKSYSEALKDFEKYNTLSQNQAAGYIGLGDSYKGLKKFKEALACYNIALEKQDYFVLTVLERRALLYFGNGEFTESLQDFNKVLKLT